MQDLRLRSIETASWKARHQDGLFDIYFGLLMLAIAVSALVEALGAPEPFRLVALIVLQFSAGGGYVLAKRRYSTPRLGTVRFGANRARRTAALRIALAAGVLITAGLVALTALGRSPIGAFHQLGRYALPTVVALVVGIPLAVIAVMQQFSRVFVHAALFVATAYALTASGHDFMDPIPGVIAFAACGTASLVIGLVVFVRFLRQRRIPAGGEER
jgi:hypothetical protein